MNTWSNWSGSLKFTPGKIIEPASEQELLEIVETILKNNQKIRMLGAGHSSSPLVVTDENLLSLKHFRSVDNIDKENSTAWIGAGLTVKEGGSRLLDHGLSFHNTGDVDIQYIAGAISTGTHGSGIKLKNLSSMLVGCRMACSDGQIKEFTEDQHGKEFFDALRVSLGTFGIMTQMKLKLLPAFQLIRKEWCTHIEDCLEHLVELINENRNFDFYWYPRNDLAKLRILNEPGKGLQKLAYAKCVEEKSGWAIDVLPKQRDLRFDEIEYALPLEAGPECFKEIRKIIKAKFRKIVAWRVLYRTIKADDFYLSPCFGRDTATISLHQNAGAPFEEYFRTIEAVFRSFDGRPHWGKKHNLESEEISQCYPRWNDFLEIRKKMDPRGIFINRYLQKKIFDL
ncbi:D-arabinono-1,4-lactone oxidase [Nitrosomonas communis]|uniref:D-arabinono-1,4-lactone oxidase n=1 Tax=Nitrosomonas communis TaxID=44574 RepID=UPI003D26EB7F